MHFDLPDKEEWIAKEESYPFEKLKLANNIFQYTGQSGNIGEEIHINNSIFTWKLHLVNRLYQTRWSYVILMHLYNKGIPDQEWIKSPGKGEIPTEYFPDFEDKDHFIKAQFDYFADVFYFKLYSSWDTIGHLLKVMYGLEIIRVNFNKAVEELKHVKPVLFNNLKNVIDSKDFKVMRKFRNDTTHNELLGHIGIMSNKVSESHYTFGSGSYTTSTQIKENVIKSLDLFIETLEAIKEQSCIDNPSKGT